MKRQSRRWLAARVFLMGTATLAGRAWGAGSEAPSAAVAPTAPATSEQKPNVAAGQTNAASSPHGPLTLAVDATNAPRRLYSMHLHVPVEPGPVELVYPEWIQGEHRASAAIENLTGLVVRAGARVLPWARDTKAMVVFRVVVPPGVHALDVSYDFLAPVDEGKFTAGPSTSDKLFVLEWTDVVLAPRGVDIRAQTMAATLTVPPGFHAATALPVATDTGSRLSFAPVTLERLLDSPVMAGLFTKTYALVPTTRPPHYLHLAADSAEALAAPPETIAAIERLVPETLALFGARHYNAYHFLYALSDHVAHFGLEHHESSDNRRPERALIDDNGRLLAAGLLPHEMVHSWNGKHRRPAGLATTNVETPLEGDLLWVYEGLTTYLGTLLAARGGLQTVADTRDLIASWTAELTATSGRRWRSLQDTATAAQVLFGAPDAGKSWRRGVDFYPEGALIWMEIDALLRTASHGERSLDDFCRAFFGGANTGPTVVPYTFDDIVKALTTLLPAIDWRQHLRARLDDVATTVPTTALASMGWRLVYDETPSAFSKARDELRKAINLQSSLGLIAREDGLLIDVVNDGPAGRAGAAPGMKLVAINGRRFSKTVLLDAVRATKAKAGIELWLENGDYFHAVKTPYAGGLRFAHLARIDGKADLLSAALAARAPH